MLARIAQVGHRSSVSGLPFLTLYRGASESHPLPYCCVFSPEVLHVTSLVSSLLPWAPWGVRQKVRNGGFVSFLPLENKVSGQQL